MDVTNWQFIVDEGLGSNAPKWCGPPDSPERWLYKPIKQRQDGCRNYDDFSEWFAYQLANLLNIPAAEIHLVDAPPRRIEGSHGPGIVSRDVSHAEDSWMWTTGQLHIQEVHDTFVSPDSRTGHNLANIFGCLKDTDAPPEATNEVSDMSGFDVFCSYLLLDALIGNQDRHEENWAVLEKSKKESGRSRLAASYDHGASLGFNQSDEQLAARLARHDGVTQYAARGQARCMYSQVGEKMTLVGAACEALAMASPFAREYWLTILKGFTPDATSDILASPPLKLSRSRVTFIQELIEENHRRILDAAANI